MLKTVLRFSKKLGLWLILFMTTAYAVAATLKTDSQMSGYLLALLVGITLYPIAIIIGWKNRKGFVEYDYVHMRLRAGLLLWHRPFVLVPSLGVVGVLTISSFNFLAGGMALAGYLLTKLILLIR